MSVQIQLRRDVAADWTSNNPTLGAGEFGYETDTGKFKIGDGTTAWNSLAYSAYTVGGTDVALADGGTGASLTDPNADRILFWDDSAGAVTWLTAGNGLTITTTTIAADSASTTVDGVVELATTAETETGTATTLAVTPDGLHDMTTLSGAAWFLDEDNMASNSAVKTASQQSIKAYADTKLALSGGTLTGPVNLGEGADPATIGLVMDNTLSADERYSGITTPGTAGATLAFGDICYLDVTAGEWLLADASAVGTAGNVPLGICVDASTDGNATSMLLIGTVRSAAFPGSIALGAPLYVSETAGDITATAPTTTDSVMRRVGWAITTEPNTIYFNPSNDHVTHV